MAPHTSSLVLLLLLLLPVLLRAELVATPPGPAAGAECVEEGRASAPVCGSDGKTYPSPNALLCANNGRGSNSVPIAVVYSGKCEEACWQAIHPDALTSGSPACASDGILYPSQQVLACVKQHQANLTSAPAEVCSTQTPAKSFDPCLLLAYVAPRKVCGSDNVTYNNVWHMACTANMYSVRELRLQHEGECNIECPYSPIYDPVCSTDEYVFANMEALHCHQTLAPYINSKLQHRGPCARNQHQNPCHVNNAYVPVCASNGRTYTGPQHVRCLKDVNSELEVLHSGPCTVEEVRRILGDAAACALAPDRYEWNPVCGSDNRTYGNPFRFLCAANSSKDLQVASVGECDSFSYCLSADQQDTSSGTQVCGTNGVTYPHLHNLYCAQSNQRHLQVKHTGACTAEDDPCLYRGTPFLDNSGTPVCASNNQTYVFPQAIWCAAKQNKGLELRHDGECF